MFTFLIPLVLASHAPPKPVAQVLGRHELMITWESPPKPLGRINSYEVRIDDIVSYIEKNLVVF